MAFLLGLFLIFFWSAVFAFVPVSYYLLVKNPPVYGAKNIQSQGIYILQEETLLERRLRNRKKTILLIYFACFVMVASCALINFLQTGNLNVYPFDILSSLSVIMFWISVIIYIPIALYIFLHNPWHFQNEGICMNRLFVGYGLGLLMFSFFFALSWLRTHQVGFSIKDIFAAAGILLFGGMALALLPSFTYHLISKIDGLRRKLNFHPNTIFVIYSICFLTFTVVYIHSWIARWKLGIHGIVW